jgi:hypothetical protein
VILNVTYPPTNAHCTYLSNVAFKRACRIAPSAWIAVFLA